MNKTEVEFLKELESKAHGERRLVVTEILPGWARGLGEWLVVNPWRVLIPISAVVYLFFRIMIGSSWATFTLSLFGGFR